jgi:hypothetical protein
MRITFLLSFLCFALFCNSQTPKHSFEYAFDQVGISRLSLKNDIHPTDYVRKGKAFGAFTLQYKQGKNEQWQTLHSQQWLSPSAPLKNELKRYTSNQQHPLEAFTTFNLKGGQIEYQLTLRNSGTSPIDVGSLGFEIPYNQLTGENPQQIFEERVMKHHFVAGHGSYLFFQRPTGKGPYLLMTPLDQTSFEYFSIGKPQTPQQGQFMVFAHAKQWVGELQEHWRLPLTEVVLAPGQEVSYGFKFEWAEDYDDIRKKLVQNKVPDIRIMPGMSVPTDLKAQFAVRSNEKLGQIKAEFPKETTIRKLPQRESGVELYEVTFKKLGENKLTLQYGSNKTMYLEFFVTEPIATLYQKRASFIANSQQIKDDSKWYDGLFGQWNMKDSMLLSPDNPDGFEKSRLIYVLTCDDPGLCKAPFLAAKNLYYPDQQEIEALDYYIDHFVWGKLQRTDEEQPYPYGIYGTPDWYTNRDVERRKTVTNQHLDKEHIWRSYDYPHLFMLYYHMYQLASRYPTLKFSQTAETYLIRTKETAKAYFTYPYDILPWYETYKWGCYNELLLTDIMLELEKKGYQEDADWLRSEWEKKVKYFIYDDPYPYRSEYSIDATAFESSHALAKYAIHTPMFPDTNLWYDKNFDRWYSHPQVHTDSALQFMEEQIQANIACRGFLENAYYLKGSDFRGNSDKYLLSYMAQMGGWAIMDYALNYASNPSDFLNLAYASYLSSFALINTGTDESDYGYWFPGKQNDGASGWAYEPQIEYTSWIQKPQKRGVWAYDGEIDLGFGGALRTAATIVYDDPDFGFIAYGGDVKNQHKRMHIHAKDGLQQRFYWLRGPKSFLSIITQLDGFKGDESGIVLDQNLQQIDLILENRSGLIHTEVIDIQGLEKGKYTVMLDGKVVDTFESKDGNLKTMLAIAAQQAEYKVRITRL